MMTLSRASSSYTLRASACRSERGFTLVELLVVIAIIGILAGLIIAGVMRAVPAANNAAISIELNQLEAALKAYKEKYGEYPPDCAGLRSGNNTIITATQEAILRHLAKAFPRYNPGSWAGFQANVLANWEIDVDTALSSKSALLFWLGGMPDWLTNASGDLVLTAKNRTINSELPIVKFLGFSTNPANPFDAASGRTQPFYEFPPTCLKCLGATGELAFWPTRACDHGYYPIVYLKANNSTYYFEGPTNVVKYCATGTATDPSNPLVNVFPAIDTRLTSVTSSVSTTRIGWVNPKSFQIFCSGLDMTYGPLLTASTSPKTAPAAWTNFLNSLKSSPLSLVNTDGNLLAFPSGEDYADETFDDITNFSGGTLESAIPQ